MQNTKVTILLATYNGTPFLDEQIHSFANQTWMDIDILVSDDGSTDGTNELLKTWQSRWTKGAFVILEGPKKGYAENFRYLINSIADKKTYVAFSDQDDIWHRDKLQNAINKLGSIGENTRSMYCSRTRLVDSSGNEIGFSPLFTHAPSFGNALTQSLAGGNTIVLNHAAFEVIRASALKTAFFSHDWWCYQILMGAGGQVYYDSVPQIDYRQHQNNVFGKNIGVTAIWRRVIGLFSGEYSQWINSNLIALETCHDLLTADNLNMVRGLQVARKRSGIRCALFLWRNDIKRQTCVANLGLYMSVLIRKLSV